MSLSDLRLGTSPVKLIGINAPFEPAFQFGREYAAANARRESAASAWGFEHNGRPLEEGSIKQPLPVREQSTLSHRLTPQLQTQLRGGMRPIQNQGRQAYRAELESVHVGEALGHQPKKQTVSAVATPNGTMGLRRVQGDYNFQV